MLLGSSQGVHSMPDAVGISTCGLAQNAAASLMATGHGASSSLTTLEVLVLGDDDDDTM